MSSSPSNRTYSMDDLTSRTGVTVRTVRYYISEGLLPPPEGAGPGTTYRDTHLNRLRLIGLLKDAYLPLKEIRRRLAAMSEEEIAATVTPEDEHKGVIISSPADMRQPVPKLARFQSDEPHPRDSAAAYIERALDQLPSSSRSPSSRSAPLVSGRLDLPGMSSSQPDSTSWRRVPITPEAELLIEEDTYTRRREQIDTALDWLRRMLNNA